MSYKFNYDKFSFEDFEKMKEKAEKEEWNYDYHGSVHVGDISIDIVFGEDQYGVGTIDFNFYVLHEDCGYSSIILENDIPYDYADGTGICVEQIENMTYEHFKEIFEELCTKYIEQYNGSNYSLAEHANRPLEMW